MMSSAPRPRILFVDDEENVLSGLKRLLRAKRGDWDMDFAASGEEALQKLHETPADVVISDMRMPKMDGAELLSHVQQLYPDTVRIILSGFANREAVIRTIGPSHRYLAKPCSEQTLIRTIDKSLDLRTRLNSDALKLSVAGLTHLPTLPKLYNDILKELSSDFASADSLAKVVERDIAVSAQLLKITNSAYFGVSHHVTNIRQAIQYLGFENVRAIVLLAGVFDQFHNLAPRAATVAETLSQRSLALGILTRKIAEHEKFDQHAADDAFSAGLLSHIGTLLLLANAPDSFYQTMSNVEHGAQLEDAERSAFGASHADLGAYLLNLWGFNHDIVDAVAYHHRPSAAGTSHNDVLTAVYAAQYLLRSGTREQDRGRDEPLDSAYLESVNAAGKMASWAKISSELKRSQSNDDPHTFH